MGFLDVSEELLGGISWLTELKRTAKDFWNSRSLIFFIIFRTALRLADFWSVCNKADLELCSYIILMVYEWTFVFPQLFVIRL